jgi:predicted small secreted protein
MKNLNKNLLCVGAMLVSATLLSACNTVADAAHGTAVGMGKDIQAVSNTMNPPRQHHHTSKAQNNAVQPAPSTATAAPATTSSGAH